MHKIPTTHLTYNIHYSVKFTLFPVLEEISSAVPFKTSSFLEISNDSEFELNAITVQII